MNKIVAILTIASAFVVTTNVNCSTMRSYRDGEFVFYHSEPYTVLNYQGHGKYILQSERDSSWIFVDETFISQ